MGFLSGDALKDIYLPGSDLMSDPPPLEGYDEMQYGEAGQSHVGSSYIKVPGQGKTGDTQDSWSVVENQGAGRTTMSQRKEGGGVDAERRTTVPKKRATASTSSSLKAQGKVHEPVRETPPARKMPVSEARVPTTATAQSPRKQVRQECSRLYKIHVYTEGRDVVNIHTKVRFLHMDKLVVALRN